MGKDWIVMTSHQRFAQQPHMKNMSPAQRLLGANTNCYDLVMGVIAARLTGERPPPAAPVMTSTSHSNSYPQPKHLIGTFGP